MPDEKALVYCEREYLNANGKTAHGLVRYTARYKIVGVVDSTAPEGDAGEILDGKNRGIPLFRNLEEANEKTKPSTFIIGAVSEGGILPEGYDKAIIYALQRGLSVVSGLHQFISDEERFTSIATRKGSKIIDVRKMFRDHKRFYTGEVSKVDSTRIATLGTDSAIGKRTTAVMLVNELRKRKRRADMIYTGQTGWMQGWPHGTVIDALINDFVSGEIEGAIVDSWRDEKPEFIIIEGQGSLVHPFFPGGFEILAAGQVHGFTLQDAPGRSCLDGFPGYPMPDPSRVIKIAKLLSQRPLVGISINHENLSNEEAKKAKSRLHKRFKVPVEDPIIDGVSQLADAIEKLRDG
ncbi:TPA: DUF1611 domain-containing protein [Candidatus Bathyarchaeota archaeon]|nr:DUF1611 domain-containing protein [Candidatus Bathyarchaeota archaeon]HIJ09052.1 DUF1611 domain-containing protein [Candidatus Bathyarchaeota archaeon]